jgi:hypothetical protein
MATLTVQPASKTGTTLNFVAATAGGDIVHNSAGNARLHVKNGSGSSITVTVPAVDRCNQGSLHDLSIPVAAGAEAEVALPKYCNHPVNGTAVHYSASATVTVAASS